MDKIVVLDFGGQYAHLIANRVRRSGVFSEIKDGDTQASELRDYKGVILSGGPASVHAEGGLKCDPGIFELGVPVLGICYGHQAMAHVLDGVVEPGRVSEYGHSNIHFKAKPGILADVNDNEDVWMSHFDQVMQVPEGFEIVGETEDCPVAAMADEKRNFYGLQFHPEVTHTACGRVILENFVQMTGAKREWNIDAYIERMLYEIREKVGDRKVFLMISGGVDSSVAFLLLSKALGQERVYGLFVDTGFMRMNEGKEVEEALKKAGVTNLHVYDGSEEYFAALKDVYEPEEKRKIIGNLFIDIQAKVSDELGLNPEEWMFGQGTIYPDWIETGGSKHSHTIKTHHNRVERIVEMEKAGRVIEPLRDLYKDEVRLVGEKLGLEHKMVWRHPFPGPGLAVRCLCTRGEDYPEGVEGLNERVAAVAGEFGYDAKVLPIKSVGVQGDERTYRHPVLLFGKGRDWDSLNKLATRLTNQFKEINRVLLCLNAEEKANLSVRSDHMTRERILTIQKADRLVMDYISESGIEQEIWQFPTVLIPVILGEGGESVVLRPICSEDVMSASFYPMKEENLNELVRRLSGLQGISGIFYDITNKPPGTVEWE